MSTRCSHARAFWSTRLRPWPAPEPSARTAPIGESTSAVCAPPWMCARTPGWYANTLPRQSVGASSRHRSMPAPQRGSPGSPRRAAASRAARMPAASETASPREAVDEAAKKGPANAAKPAIAATARSGAVAGEVRWSRVRAESLRRWGRSACFSGSTTAAVTAAAPKRSSRWRFAACARCAAPAAAAASAIVAAAALRKVPGAEAPGADAFPPSAAARSVRRVFLASPLTAEFDFPREAHAMPPVMPLCPLSLEYLLQSTAGCEEDPPAG
mmetsp:Transcript_9052/g.39846  ORF Transcript_9052/g.39846 Transcript_9052/m.39846 type:complete len:271 (-) Transcript_9052:1523-2335(-)